MKKIWNFLSGKKTAIGAILSTIIGFLNIKGMIDSETATFLLSIASIIIGIGVTHKAVKASNKNNG